MKNKPNSLDSKPGIKNLKWNFSMGLLHGIFFYSGQAFGNPNTIIPVFLNNLTSSKAIIGLSSTIIGSFGGIGSVIPQLFVANRIENKLHKRPLLRIAITIRALCWALLSISTFLIAPHFPKIMISLLFLFLLTFTFMGGVATIPFYDIWAKSLPSRLRGRFFSHRQFWGGILAIGAGYITKLVLGSNKIIFPQNYALLFLFTFIFITISYIALGSVREPKEAIHKKRLDFGDFLKKAIYIFKKDRNYRYFIYVQILIGGSAIALPFYVLYAKDFLEIKLEMVGTFLIAQMIGSVMSNILWAYVSDFIGNKRVIQISSFLAFIIPIIAVLTGKNNATPFILVFAFIGFFIAGRNIGKTNFLLDIAPVKDRPTYISFINTLSIPVMLFPLLGGYLVQSISFRFVFVITAIVSFMGFVMSFWLKEPRNKKRKK